MNAPRRVYQRVAIGLGASLGDRRATLERTLQHLHRTPGLELLRCSRWVRTPPMRGGTATGWFLNGVALFRSELQPHEMLDLCRQLEQRAGRRRSRWWGDRTLDLDLLLADDLVLDDAQLVVPHPAIAARPFVVGPLLEVWPGAIDARTGLAFAGRPAPTGPRAVPVGVVARGP
jgi:2-amino-4-hydroxy-6-hydroxymethyldihydropteridine diphosphokinase